MKLYDVATTVLRLAQMDPTICFAEIGDIYELNHQQDIQYPAIVLTQNTHIGNLSTDQTVFNFTLFAIDRQTEDGKNKLEVQSWAVDVLNSALQHIEEERLGIVGDNYEIKVFSQRFESICAGAFVNISITVTNDTDCCVCVPTDNLKN